MRANPTILNIEAFLTDHKRKPLTPHEFHHLKSVLANLFGGSADTVYFYDVPSEDYMKGQFRDRNFASISLNKSDEKKFQAWVESQNLSAVQIAEDFLARGYKISVTWVTNNNAFCLSVIGTDECRTNKQAIMTSWSDTLEETFFIAAYKHLVMCNEGDWPIAGTDNRWG